MVVTLKDGQKTIQQIDTQSGTRTELLPRVNENISHPQPWGQYVFYNSPRSGIDNVYAVDVTVKSRYSRLRRGRWRLTTRLFLPPERRLAFEDFSAVGYRIADMPLNPRQLETRYRTGAPEPVRFFGNLPKLEPGAALGRAILADSAVTKTTYSPTRFRRLANAINVYSWGPTVNSTGQALSVGLSSQDLLSTTQIGVGYTYNQAERAGNVLRPAELSGALPHYRCQFPAGNPQDIALH